jgi:NAD+ kinase
MTDGKPSLVKHVLIVHRDDTPQAKQLGQDFIRYLSNKGIKADLLGYIELSKIKFDNQSDLVVVLGGDGTYLSTVGHIKPSLVPILGINMGSLGFLTETKINDAYETLDLALGGLLESRPRRLLDICVRHADSSTFTETALNDIVIERGARSQLVRIQIYSGDFLVQDLKADGLIISTPTGSTAYNLAVGGPILHPDVQGFVLTPVAPHSLTSRPIVFPDHLDLKIRLAAGNQTAQLTVDGRKVSEVTDQDLIKIEKSKHVHNVLRKHGHNYFDLLREKLKFGERS